MKVVFCILLAVTGALASEDTRVEGRGKAKYALLTNLAILLAAKVGLVKIVVGIALVIGSLKFLLVLAWALAIFKYVPDPYIYYNSQEYQRTPLHLDYNPFDHDHYGHNQYSYDRNKQVHFFYVVATKLFVLKIIYGALFYALIIKGWHFVSWFIHYLKEKKHKPYVPYGHDSYGHDSYGPASYGPASYGPASYGPASYGPASYGPASYGHNNGYDLSSYGHYEHEHYEPDNYGQEYVSDSYNSYAFDKKRHDSKKAYDADGSYSVKS